MKQRGRRTIVTRAMVFLVLGAIVNVAVAWAGSFSFQPNSKPTVQIGVAKAAAVWNDHSQPYWTKDRVTRGSLERTCGGELFVLHGSGTVEMRGGGFAAAGSVVFAYEFGWPTRALFRTHLSAFWADHTRPDPCSCMVSSIPFARAHPNPHPLPVCILWPGFAINTVFYSIILWLLCAAPFALRRRSRIMRGLCPACAYPIGESDVCTECGATHIRTKHAIAPAP